MAAGSRLLHACEWFIREQDIQCREAIRTDRVTAHAAQLIEQVCGIVGYAVPPAHPWPPLTAHPKSAMACP